MEHRKKLLLSFVMTMLLTALLTMTAAQPGFSPAQKRNVSSGICGVNDLKYRREGAPTEQSPKLVAVKP